jgi:hypothetical protein
MHLKKYLDQKDLTEEDREVVHSKYTLSSMVRSSGFIFIVVFVVASVSFKNIIDGLVYYRYSTELSAQAANCILS